MSGPGAGVGVALVSGGARGRAVMGLMGAGDLVVVGHRHRLAGDYVEFVWRVSRISWVPDGSKRSR